MFIHEKNHQLLIDYRIQSEVFQKEKEKLKNLNNQIMELRKICNHDYQKPHENFAYEGGVCKICGINELVALSKMI